MAEILPIKAWRYEAQLGKNIEALTAPLFDVVSSKQREILYQNPLNSIHLSVPQGEQPHLEAKNLLERWKAEGILKHLFVKENINDAVLIFKGVDEETVKLLIPTLPLSKYFINVYCCIF